MKNEQQTLLECIDLIPSYFTEIFFCLFVLFHIFVEGKTKYDEPVQQDRSGTNVDTIPVYIVKDSLER